MVPGETRQPIFKQPWTWWFMVAMLAIVAFARLRMMNFPLERDEGEYAYAGQLILQGIPPYELAYNMKFPGTYLGYAIFMKFFGETPGGIHFGLMLMTTTTACMLYWLGKRILDETTGVIAAVSYAVLGISTAMFGFSAHATHFGAFCLTVGLCLMWQARRKEKWLLPAVGAGFFFGCAILTKQHAVFVALWAALIFTADMLGRKEIPPVRRWLALVAMGMAMILPFGLCCLVLWRAGVFGEFWFWTMDYARAYVSLIPLSQAGAQLSWSLHSIFSDCWLWWVAVAGVIVVWFDDRLRGIRLWLMGFVFAAIMTTVPGFYFRTHYFLMMLPAAALMAGCAVSSITYLLRKMDGATKFRHLPAGAFAVVLALVLFKDADVVSVLTRVGGHALYGYEPFPEAVVVATYIREHSTPKATLAVLGSEPEIPFLARRHSATGYIYVYGLMESQPFEKRMRKEMVHEIETNAPEFIVYVNVNSSWHQTSASDPTVFKWWHSYQTNYDLVGVVEMDSLLKTRYFWNTEAVGHGKLKGMGLEIYRRKSMATSPDVSQQKENGLSYNYSSWPGDFLRRPFHYKAAATRLTLAATPANFPAFGAAQDPISDEYPVR